MTYGITVTYRHGFFARYGETRWRFPCSTHRKSGHMYYDQVPLFLVVTRNRACYARDATISHDYIYALYRRRTF